MLGRGDQVMGIEMTVNDLEHSDQLASAIEKALGGPPYQAMDWYELNKNLFTTLYGARRP
jgi:ABC-type lipoprotein release transport system permease subunit